MRSDENNLGLALLSLGDVDRAEELRSAASRHSPVWTCPGSCAAGLDEVAVGIARARGEDARAAQLLGARDGLAASLGIVPAWMTADTVAEALRQSLGAEAFDRAYAEGRDMSLEQTVDCASRR